MTSQIIFLGAFGWTEIAIIAVVILLLFGGKKIPELMRGLGGGLKEFKKAAGEDEEKTDKQEAAPKKDETPSFKEKN